MTITATRTWADLCAHRQKTEKIHLRELFASDPQRTERLSLTFDDILFDFSKQRVTPETLALLVKLAEEALIHEWIGRMFACDHINVTEYRSV